MPLPEELPPATPKKELIGAWRCVLCVEKLERVGGEGEEMGGEEEEEEGEILQENAK